MDGVVILVEAEEGQTLNAAQSTPTILNLADLDTITVKRKFPKRTSCGSNPAKRSISPFWVTRIPVITALCGPSNRDRNPPPVLPAADPAPAAVPGSTAVFIMAFSTCPTPTASCGFP
jgi:hypothetical protein